MQIRKATEKDIDVIMSIYERARKYMAENNNPNQWINGYPQKEIVMRDINEGISYVYLIDDQIEGVFVLLETPDPTYAVIEGAWLYNEPYVTIHRVASKGTRKGVLSDIVDWCSGKYVNIRIDTHKDNVIMQHLLEKKGFIKCGIIYLANGSPRIAFHKKG